MSQIGVVSLCQGIKLHSHLMVEQIRSNRTLLLRSGSKEGVASTTSTPSPHALYLKYVGLDLLKTEILAP